MIRAFAYLIVTSFRNRLRSQLLRVRNPRYAIAFLLGAAYFSWFVFFNRSARQGPSPGPLFAETLGAVLPVIVLLVVGYAWIFGADRTALAFSEAEVAMLFPAPVPRRGLIVYKLVRAQAAVLVTSLLWTLLLRNGGAGGAQRAVSFWVLLSTISVHRLGVALIRASQGEHGAKGAKHHRAAIALFGIVAAVVMGEVFAARTQLLSAAESGEFFRQLVDTFSAPPLGWVMYPFRIALAPVFAPHGMPWVRAMLPAIALLLVHVWWVLRTDSAFEEAAADASTALARRLESLRSQRGGGGVVKQKNVRRTLPLGATGSPGVAIIWKNYLWLVRTGQVNGLVGLPVVAGLVALAFAGRSETAEILVVVLCGAVAGMVVVFGPMAMRNDLRDDLLRLPILKTLPLRGHQIMLAEVLSSASPTAMMQILLVGAGLLATCFIAKMPVTTDARLGILIAAPALLFGLNLANFTVHNGMALLFPAWVRLGASGPSGIEAIGQSMLSTIVTMLMLLVLLLAPALVAGVAFFFLRHDLRLAIASSGWIAGVLLALEAYLLVQVLGGSLDRLEPMQVG